MIKEKSCGAVIYKDEEGVRKYLVLKMRKGHYSMCKGHVEGDETEKQTALREIGEETNLSVKIDTRFRRVITYSPYPGCLKDVVYFVAKTDGANMRPQESEVSACIFLPLDEAQKTLSHKSDFKVLLAADKYLQRFE